jgi:hypothetical protein
VSEEREEREGERERERERERRARFEYMKGRVEGKVAHSLRSKS